MIPILKEAKYKAKWRRPKCPPVPGDTVYCCWDYFKVINVIQRPFQGHMLVADLEVKPIGPVEPMFLSVYERGGFYVSRLGD